MNLGPLQYNQVREPLAITGGERTEVVHTAMSYGAFSIPDNALLCLGPLERGRKAPTVAGSKIAKLLILFRSDM